MNVLKMGTNVSKEPLKIREKTKEPTVHDNHTPEAAKATPSTLDFLANTGVIRSSSKLASLVSGRKQSMSHDQALKTRLEPSRTSTKGMSAGEEFDYDNPGLYSIHPQPLHPITGRRVWQRIDPMVLRVIIIPFPPSVPFVITRAAPAITHYGNRSSVLPGHRVISSAYSTLVPTPGTTHSMTRTLFPVCSRRDNVYGTAAQTFGTIVSSNGETARTFRTYRTASPLLEPMVVVRPSSFTQMYGPHVSLMYPQYSYNMPRRIY